MKIDFDEIGYGFENGTNHYEWFTPKELQQLDGKRFNLELFQLNGADTFCSGNDRLFLLGKMFSTYSKTGFREEVYNVVKRRLSLPQEMSNQNLFEILRDSFRVKILLANEN